MAQPTSKVKFWQLFRDLDPLAKSISLGLLTVTIGGLGWLAFQLWEHNHIRRIVLAAGNPTGESYVLAKAIETVVEANVPKVDIEVQATKGTIENLERIEKNKADLATAQADAPAGEHARTVAILYSDCFQLMVQGKSTLQKFTDLKGKRIGLTPKSGQYESFLQIAQHFGLTDKDFTFIGASDQAADLAFQQGQVDAIFRVRAIGNPQISALIQNHGARLIPIEQTEAMRVKYPAFEPTKLPKGSYQGKDPTVPAEELSTVAIHRLLLAHENVDPDLIQQITQALNEHRRDLQSNIPNTVSNAAPLVSNIRRPEITGGTGIAIHPGALSYYDRDEPSFLQQNADYVALILTVCLLIGSWFLELKRWIELRRQNIVDQYIAQVVEIMQACNMSEISPYEALAKIDGIFEKITIELVQERISQESFQSFNEIYRSIRAVIDRKDRIAPFSKS